MEHNELNYANLQATEGTLQRYDCIFALHILTTIPADRRLQSLGKRKRLHHRIRRISQDV